MSILFSDTPAPGHLSPLLPLVGAGRHADCEVARPVGADVDDLGPDAATFATGIAVPIDGGIVA